MIAHATKSEDKIDTHLTRGSKSIFSNHFELAYAVTCHSAQGVEWDRVAVLLDDTLDNFQDAACNWFYTAVTRARKEVVVVDASGQMAKRGFSFNADETFGTAPVSEAAPAVKPEVAQEITPAPMVADDAPVMQAETPAPEMPAPVAVEAPPVAKKEMTGAELLASFGSKREDNPPAPQPRPEPVRQIIQPMPEVFDLLQLITDKRGNAEDAIIGSDIPFSRLGSILDNGIASGVLSQTGSQFSPVPMRMSA